MLAFALLVILLAADVADAACKGRGGGTRVSRAPAVINVPSEGQREASCPTRPRSDCAVARSSRIIVHDAADGDDHLLVWRWNGDGPIDGIEDAGGGARLGLCVYDSFEGAPFLLTSLRVEPGRKWSGQASAWRYRASRNDTGGVTSVLVRGGAKGKSRIRWKAEGERLRLPQRASRSRYFHQDDDVVVQLVSGNADRCWSSTYREAGKNVADAFVASNGVRRRATAAGSR